MECKLQQICKFCQGDAALLIQLPRKDFWEYDPVTNAWTLIHLPVSELEPVQIVGGGSIKEKPAGRLWHCKKCAFTAPNAGVMASHCRLKHPKGPADRKPGKKTAAAKKAPKESARNKEAENAFKVLQKRANKGKLTEEQSTVYDNLEPGIIGLPVEKWPDGSREAVFKLYKDVTGEKEE